MTPLDLAPAAFLAGLLMFLAPCTLPLVPAYLAFISGVSPLMLEDKERRREVRSRVFRNALFFVIGFSVLFVLLGSFAGFLGSSIGPWRAPLSRAAGALLVLFGITMLGVRIPLLSVERRFKLPRFLSLGRAESSFLAGALFALGWSPCVGPVLGGILLFASSSATALSGAALLTIFSLGLALPFLLTAFLIGEASLFLNRLSPLAAALQLIGGAILVGLGLLMILGKTALLVTWGYGFFEFLNYGALLNYL